MDYYPALISAAFASVAGDRPQVARAASCMATGEAGEPEFPHIPTELLPERLEHIRFATGGSFMDGLSDPKLIGDLDVIFVAPPFYAQTWTPWFRKIMRYGMADLLLAKFMGDCFDVYSGRPKRKQTDLEPPACRASDKRSGNPMGGQQIDALVMLLSKRALYHWEARRRHDGQAAWLRDLDLTFVEHAHGGVTQRLAMPDNSTSPFVTLIARRGAGSVRFMKITRKINEMGAGAIAKDLKRLLSLKRGKSKFGYVRVADPDLVRARWRHDANSDETANLVKTLGEAGKSVPLSTIADIWWGRMPLSFSKSANSTPEFLTRIQTTDESVLVLSEDTVRVAKNDGRSGRFLRDGDICLADVHTSDELLQLGVYKSDGRKLSVSRAIAVIRLHADVSPRTKNALVDYLNTVAAYRLAKAKGIFLDNARLNLRLRLLNHRRLAEFPVPIDL